MVIDFTKEFFQQAWGEDGYYERFTYGVGFDKVVQTCLVPFFNLNHRALEIGSGGGTFTEKMVNRFEEVAAADVIKKPQQFNRWDNSTKFYYLEIYDNFYDLGFMEDKFDFTFSYNCFCHLSNKALKQYLISVQRALKPSGNFVFMLANYEHSKKQLEGDNTPYQLGDLLPFGHFYQDERTLPLIMGEGWEIVSPNMIPEHRDIIVHLKKK